MYFKKTGLKNVVKPGMHAPPTGACLVSRDYFPEKCVCIGLSPRMFA